MRALTAIAVVLILAAIGAFVFGGVVTVWDGDSGEDVVVHRIDLTAVFVYVLSVVALIAAVAALWIRRTAWVVVVSSILGAVLALWLRQSVLSRAQSVNNFIAIEGGSDGMSNGITRAVRGNLTDVDSDIIAVGWIIGAALLLAAAASAGCSIWLGHRRDQTGDTRP